MTDSYCSVDDVAAALGITLGEDPDEILVDRMSLAALLGTSYVMATVSGDVIADELSAPYTVTAVACPPAWRAAAIVAAVRYFSAKDVPFGAVAIGEYGRVLGSIPEADLLLRGHRADFGFG